MKQPAGEHAADDAAVAMPGWSGNLHGPRHDPEQTMTRGDYAQSFTRGKKHEDAARWIDAMICYRRAVRADPRAAEARSRLGEVLYKLGFYQEARAEWHHGLQSNPGNLTLLLQLAQAAFRAGNYAEAAEAYRNIVAANPQHSATLALAMVRVAQADPGGYVELSARLAAGAPFELWDELAGVLATAPPSPERTALLLVVSARPEAMPPLLLACVAEELVAAGRMDAARRTLGRAGLLALSNEAPETLRRLALAAAGAGSPGEWAERYAQRCAELAAASMPLLWPRRTAGGALRVVYLVDTRRPLSIGGLSIDIEAYLRSVVAGHAHERFAATVFAIGEPPLSTLDTAVGPDVRVAAMGFAPDSVLARSIAETDADALIDLIGLGAPVGALLAQRPARTVWTYREFAHANVAPLIRHWLPSPRGSNADALAQHRAVLERSLLEACATAPWFADVGQRTTAELDAAWRSAVAAHQSGDLDAALAGYQDVLAEQPKHAAGQYLLGKLLHDRGRGVEARRVLKAAVAAAPRSIDARLALADSLLENRNAWQAAAVCEEGLRMAPTDASLWRALGRAFLAQRDGAAARRALRSALNFAPAHAMTHYNVGVALQMLGNRKLALLAYQRALALDPRLAAADFNVGIIFREQARIDQAIAAFERVLAHDPRHVPAHKALADTLQGERRLDAWLRAFDRFEAACPDAFPLLIMALEVYQYRADFAGLDRYLDRLRHDEFKPSSETELADCLEELLFLLLYFDIEPEMQLGLCQAYDAVARRVYGIPLGLPTIRRPGRVRVGYLSGDLRNHVMGKMMYPALARHDRNRFELFFYSLSAESDEWTNRYRALGDHFEVIAELSEQDAAKRIAADELDILVDLATHTRGAKPGILALKPARVQITHVASAGAVGLSTIDFKLTDAFADVPDTQQFQLETLLPMAGCVYPYHHVPPAAVHPFRRAVLGIAPDAVVIGAFVSPLKLSRRCLALWREVLDRIPNAILAISPMSAERRAIYSRLFSATGIAEGRVCVIAQGRDDAENQARYELVDFVLDPMPYGGVNGTLEALDMTVPVISLAGRRHGERSAYSILLNLGVTQTVATSGTEYVSIAVRLATDRAFMAEVKAAIRAGLERSSLTDIGAYTRHLEQAYLQALQQRFPAGLAAIGNG